MGKSRKDYLRSEFDYEEDEYDRLQRFNQKTVFTNKAQMKKFEFDYEEDAYEPLEEDMEE
ncbi:MAG: hypothetical protein ACOYVK_19930 [Bacillota bacterium]